ncbi:hypothetical protein EDB84DRAFT_1441662 [Lactarius hengduanensis]|nr:hypothetical protein EDB84DRAFT_1441662 [Lactarius hengduanensis]
MEASITDTAQELPLGETRRLGVCIGIKVDLDSVFWHEETFWWRFGFHYAMFGHLVSLLLVPVPTGYKTSCPKNTVTQPALFHTFPNIPTVGKQERCSSALCYRLDFQRAVFWGTNHLQQYEHNLANLVAGTGTGVHVAVINTLVGRVGFLGDRRRPISLVLEAA